MSAGPTAPPECPAHGKTMVLREPAAPEHALCGAWYDCAEAGCTASALLPSPELAAFYAAGERPAWLGGERPGERARGAACGPSGTRVKEER